MGREDSSVSVDIRVGEDCLTGSISVTLEGDADVPTEEVISYLESEGLAPKTRKRIRSINLRDGGATLLIKFKDGFEWTFKGEIIVALLSFFEKRGVPACAAA